MVSVPAFYSDDPSSNPAGYLINFLYEKTKINEKEARVGPFKKGQWDNLYLYIILAAVIPITNDPGQSLEG